MRLTQGCWRRTLSESVWYCFFHVLGMAVVLSFSGQVRADVIYVDDDAAMGGDGASWATAYRCLQDALYAAEDGDEIHVAGGVYKPDADEAGTVATGDRSASFVMTNGVGVYGGYAGIGAVDPNARDIADYETILSGDLACNDGPDFANNCENSYQVASANGLAVPFELWGISVSSGRADGADSKEFGGGLFVSGSCVRLTDCTFKSNWAIRGGGVSVNSDSTLTAVDCTIQNNWAYSDGNDWNRSYGGGVYATHSRVTIVDCLFAGNVCSYCGTGGGHLRQELRHGRDTQQV